ncbi:DUF4142 domain-containing protein [Lysobacter silvisoli]|nr:DUF4142 domain-containing protein [Lysobacter silvisoli]
MIRPLPVLIVFAALFSAPGAAQEQPQGFAFAWKEAVAAAAEGGGVREVAGDDRHALGLLAALDENEIAAAQQAVSKQVTGDVLAYAQLMLKAHGENLSKTRALGPPSDDADVAELKDQGRKELATLNALSGPAYAKAYIDAMVKGHTDALTLIDQQMMPAAQHPAVEKHLTQTRAHVADHLARAKQIAATD